MTESERLQALGILRVRADNPGPLTLSGTNSWVVGHDPAYIVDPGPLAGDHVDRLVTAVDGRGGLGGIVLTHGHSDHVEATAELRSRRPCPVAAHRRSTALGADGGELDVGLAEGERFGPFEAVETPGHCPDHLALVAGRSCFTGDAILGEGSVFIAPDPHALAGYLAGLARLRERDLDVLCPGHGDPLWDARAAIDRYVEHRNDRQRRLVAALRGGARSIDDLLDAAWSEVPPRLRPLATVTLAAHLDKLADEGPLPEGVERPEVCAVKGRMAR